MIRALLAMLLATPTLTGLATHYDASTHAGRLTRSGEPYRANAPACAVDDERWNELCGKWLLVVASNGRRAVLRVNDSGYLSKAGTFAWSNERGYYVPAPDSELLVVVDIPEDTFRRLGPDGETIHVKVWILEEFIAWPPS